MTTEDKIALIVQSLEISGSTKINEAKALSEIPEYDSFGQVLIITMLKKQFSRTITKEEIEGLITVQDILDRMG